MYETWVLSIKALFKVKKSATQKPFFVHNYVRQKANGTKCTEFYCEVFAIMYQFIYT